MSGALEIDEMRQDDTARADDRSLARAYLSPRTQAAVTLKGYERGLGNLDLLSLVEQLQDQVEAARSGDLRRADEMLVAQAHTLDRLFNALLQDGAKSGELAKLELYLKYALRAQAQARATWETLSEMKSPRSVALFGQANFAAVQQVNNGVTASERTESGAPAGENRPSKVLEAQHEPRLDTRPTQASVRSHSTVEAVATFNRTKIR